MSPSVADLEAWYVGLGILGTFLLFALGILADETLRGIYHWLFDRRLASLWRKLLLRRTKDIQMEVRQTLTLARPEELSESSAQISETRDAISTAMWADFDLVEKRGDSIIVARSKRSEDFSVDLDVLPSGTDPTRVAATVKVVAKVPYNSIAESITQAVVELQLASRALAAAAGGMAPDPNRNGITLTVKISKPPEVLEILREFKISNVEGNANVFEVELGSDHATFKGEAGRELAKAVKDVVTWYY